MPRCAASLAEALKTNARLVALELEANKIIDSSLKEIGAQLARNRQLPKRSRQAAVALEVLSGSRYPSGLFPLISQQLLALPSERMEDSLRTMDGLSRWIGNVPGHA